MSATDSPVKPNESAPPIVAGFVSAEAAAAKSSSQQRRVAVVLNKNALKVDARVVQAMGSVTPQEDLYVSATLAEAQSNIRTIVERDYDTVLFGGGDGTFVRGIEQLTAICRESGRRLPAVGVLRLGTGNAMADAVGAGPLTWDGLVRDVLRARNSETARPLPLLETVGRITPFCGFGADAQILEDHEVVCEWLDKSPLGRVVRSSGARYAASVVLRSIPRFVAKKRTNIVVRNLGAPALQIGRGGVPALAPVPAGEIIWQGAASMAACSTIPFFGMRMKMFPYAEMRPDRFQLRTGDPSLFEMVSSLKDVFEGKYESDHKVDYLCDHISIECDSPQPYEVGGELVGRLDRVEIKLGDSFRVA